MEINFPPTNTSEIHLLVEQPLQNTYWRLAEDVRPPKRQETPYVPGRPQATYTQRWGQIQSWTPGAVWTKKKKGNLSQQPQEQRIKSPQSTWCTLHLWNTWIDNESSKIEAVDFGSNNIYIFFPFYLFVSVYVYASVCDFVCIILLLPFVLGFCLSVFFFFF